MAPRSALLLITAARAAWASTVNFASMFVGDSVILQSGVEVRVFGTAQTPSSLVVVSLDGKQVSSTVSTSTGVWEAVLPPQAPTWGALMTAQVPAQGGGSVSNSVRFGHVVMCSGQSNVRRHRL